MDAAQFRQHIGTRMADEDIATEAPLRAIVATFDRQETAPRTGEAIPPGWHIGYFLPMSRKASLAADGLPTGTGVLPKLPLPRRMFAGTRITFHAPILVGDALRRETELTDLAVREGGTGTLIITTQTRRISSPRGLALTEEADTVFREAVKPGAKSDIPKRDEVPANLPWRQTVTTDPVTLFRFSALTFNPHRIHYDRPYAMEVEGYPGLVVHGPFTQACLINFVRDNNPGRTIRTFSMRARAPLFDTAPFDLVGRPTDGGSGCEVWAVTPAGTIAMQATATLDWEPELPMLLPVSTPPLPPGIRSRFVEGINGLTMHVLEAGFEDKERPCLLLLHGFPELAYSWRKVMLPLAAAGFHVVAPDQRGYGRTTGWIGAYDGDLGSFRVLNLVRDALGLVSALGYRTVAGVVGHDFGSPVAAWCALVRPDVFRSVALMSAPFSGPPQIPFDTDAQGPRAAASTPSIHDELARLTPPRKHYHWYYSTREADANMREAAQGIHAFLRAYYHHKSADWPGNKPHPLKAWMASQLAKLPTYYVMELDKGMAESVAPFMPTAAEVAACKWLTEDELAFYSQEYTRTGFQGGLQWYRVRTSGRFEAEQEVFSGRTIDVPATFISGKSDWGVYQTPGALERMQSAACTRWAGTHLVDGAGHWVQQEQPEAVTRLLLEFLRAAGQARA